MGSLKLHNGSDLQADHILGFIRSSVALHVGAGVSRHVTWQLLAQLDLVWVESLEINEPAEDPQVWSWQL